MPPNKRKATDVDESPIKLRRSERIRQRNTEPTNLLDLNDDCLTEMLSYLSEVDLCALAATSNRLKNVCEHFVRTKYRSKLFELKRSFGSQNFMQNFGKVLTRMTIDCRELDPCPEKFLFVDFTNLVELAMVDVKFSSNFVNRTKGLCQNLIKLSIASFKIKIDDNDLRQFVLACTKLESLNIYARPNGAISTRFLDHRFPAMKEISIRKHYDAKLDYQRAHIQKFLEQNRQIESVTFDFQKTQIDSKIFDDISNYSVNIKSIQIRLSGFVKKFKKDLANLNRLENLVELDVNGNGKGIADVIHAFSNLETLGLSNTSFDAGLVNALCKLIKLKTLKLYQVSGINATSLKRLSQGQHSLINLHFVAYGRDNDYHDYYDDHDRYDRYQRYHDYYDDYDRDRENRLQRYIDYHRDHEGEEDGVDDLAEVLPFIEVFAKLQSLTFTRRKFHYWDTLLLDEGDFVRLANARKRAKAIGPLTVFMNTVNFEASMRAIDAYTLDQNMRYVQLVEDKTLSYATQLD